MEPNDIVLQAKIENLLVVRMEAILVEHGDFQGVEVHPGGESTLQHEVDFAVLLVERAMEDIWENLPAGDADTATKRLWERLQDAINREVEAGKPLQDEEPEEEEKKEF